MNIRGLAPQLTSALQESRPVNRVERSIKSDESHDRDANGQQGYENQKRKPEMTEEQLEQALQHLQALPAFAEHKWTAELSSDEHGRYVLVKDNLGSVIRKIPELELWSLPDADSPKGQLLKKAA